ncbi:MAG: hypothetical protein U0441_09650 [Polyangiaceae bacterium]
MHTLDEVGREADTVRSEIELLYVRGLGTSTPADRRKLADLAAEWDRLGAAHVASKLTLALQKADADAKDAARALLSAYTSLHVFERVLSLEAAADAWTAHLEASRAEEGDESDPGESPDGSTVAPAPNKASPPTDKPAAAPPIEDPTGTLQLVEELSRAVEDLVRTGLSSASESTRAKLDASFKEASRRKLLRLGASLRYVNEEVGRFLADDGSFSIRRFAFFLHRSWMQARGLAKGIREKDGKVLATLLMSGASPPRPIQWIDVVTLGVLKRTMANACTFDFRLRVVAASEPDVVGRSLVYSLVFTRKASLPAEAYLHLPQPQKFAPRIFTLGKVLKITGCALMLDDRGGRLMMGPNTKVTEGVSFKDWRPLYGFDPAALLERVQKARVGPLDLAVELQEEVYLQGAEIGDAPSRESDGRRLYPLRTEGGLAVDVVIPSGTDGDDLLPRLKKGLKSRGAPLLYGLCYYEFGRILVMPLSIMQMSDPAKAEPEPAAPAAKGKAPKPKPPPKTAEEDALSNGAPALITLMQKSFDMKELVGALGL